MTNEKTKWEARDKRQSNSQEWRPVNSYEAESKPLQDYEYRLINPSTRIAELEKEVAELKEKHLFDRGCRSDSPLTFNDEKEKRELWERACRAQKEIIVEQLMYQSAVILIKDSPLAEYQG